MESSPSLLSAGLAVLSALLYLVAVWRQVLNLEAGAEHQRQQIALVGAAALHPCAGGVSPNSGGGPVWDSIGWPP